MVAPVPWLSLLLLPSVLLLPLALSPVVGVLSPEVGVVVMPGPVMLLALPVPPAVTSRPPSSPPQPATAAAKNQGLKFVTHDASDPNTPGSSRTLLLSSLCVHGPDPPIESCITAAPAYFHPRTAEFAADPTTSSTSPDAPSAGADLHHPAKFDQPRHVLHFDHFHKSLLAYRPRPAKQCPQYSVHMVTFRWRILRPPYRGFLAPIAAIHPTARRSSPSPVSSAPCAYCRW